jgi:hypothetical protein
MPRSSAMVFADHLFNASTVMIVLKNPINILDMALTECYFPIFAPKITEI